MERSEMRDGVGWSLNSGTVRGERQSPHPAARYTRVDPPPAGEGEEKRRATCIVIEKSEPMPLWRH